MKYSYIATKEDGSMVEGVVEAQELNDVLQYLSGQKLKPINVKKIGNKKSSDFSFFKKKISISDLVFLSKYLALMLRIGTGLMQALDVLIEDFKKPAMREFLLEARQNLERGLPFATVFAKYPHVFTPVYINLVRAGEASGNLEEVFENLSVSLSKEKMIRDQIKSALIYPILLFSVSVLVLIFMVIFVLPKVANVFTQSGFEPPTFSRIVFSVGLFFGQYGVLFLVFVAGLVGGGVFLYQRNLGFKKFISSMINEIPAVKDIIKKISIQRFAGTLSSLVKAGLPMMRALEITADASGRIELKEALQRVSNEGIAKGLTLGEAFKREKYFPSTVSNLMAISEKAGHIDEVLVTLSEFYGSEIDTSLKTLVSFLEPALLLFIGVIIAIIALSIITPIYQFTTQF